MTQGLSGHRGQLTVLVNGTVHEVTGVEGATLTRGIELAKWGGFGHSTRRSTPVMPDGIGIEANDMPWDDSTLGNTLSQVREAQTSGTYYYWYFYPRGAVDQTKYGYGYMVFSEADLDVPIDDVIRLGFGLENSAEWYDVGNL